MDLIKNDKKNELIELSGGTTDLLIELLTKYIENTPELLEKAREGLRNNDADIVDYAVHTMKGSSLSLGLEPLGEFLIELNQRTKQKKIDGMEKDFDQIDLYLEDVKKYLRELS